MVELTDAGRVFLAEARRTLMQADLARKMAQRAGAKAIEVRIGLMGAALYRVLPALIVAFRQSSPGVEIRLFERPSRDQINELLSGELDIGFVSVVTEHIAGLETVVVERASAMAVVPASWDLAQRESITLHELAEQPFILPPQRYAPYFSETLAMFKHIGVMPQVIQEATQMNTTMSLAGAGLGCSIVTTSAALAAPRTVKFLRIKDMPPVRPWELLMAWGTHHLNGAATNFLRLSRDYVAAHPELLDATGLAA